MTMKTLRPYCVCFIAIFVLVSCQNQPRIKMDIAYPDLISPIYYIDTFQVISPRIAIVDSVSYIFSLEKLMPFENKADFLRQKGVIRRLTPNMHTQRVIDYIKIFEHHNWKKTLSSLATQNEFEFEEIYLPDDSINNIPVYKFVFQPETFLLTFVSSVDSVIRPKGVDDVILDIVYTNDYVLALSPIYRKQDLRKINELWYRRLHGRELDWSKY